MVWYILVLEMLIVFYAIRVIYHAPTVRYALELCGGLIGLCLTHLMISRF